ncbi:hypothetical protein [Nocardioides sp.]|jgi:hypothetical protein|uniref:hypothetical protein n=1 Tax=Nocardioides sp. TaxID=35761 RepID=UPI0031FE5C64|nr:hypothetical protein [Nocardioides sp.]
MQFRRNIALAAGALVLAAPVLSSCGFNYATDRINTNAAGVNNRDKTVDVLNAVIVASHADTGTFIATLSNNSATKPATFSDLTGANGNTLTADSFAPITIPATGVVSLATAGGVRVSGTFEAGQFVPVTVGFDSGEAVVLDIPVVTACGDYAGLDDAPTTEPLPSSSTDSPSASDSASPTVAATPTEQTTPYSCDYPTPGGE